MEIVYITYQYQDFFNAYIYAQDVILPIIRKNGIAANTPDLLLGWLDKLHSFIAQTMAVEAKALAGSYTQQRVWRWNPNFAVSFELENFLLSKDFKACILYLENNTKLYRDESRQLLEYLLKVQEDNSIEPDEKEKKYIPLDDKGLQAKITFCKLLTLHDNNLIDVKINPILNKILKICMPVEKYKAEMQKFATTLLQNWAKCGNTNAQIATL